MPDLAEIIKAVTPEQIQKAKVCKTVDEILAFANAEGIDITAEQAEAILKTANPPQCELTDEELDNVAGGQDKVTYYAKCPKCQRSVTWYSFPPDEGQLITFFCNVCHEKFTTSQYTYDNPFYR